MILSELALPISNIRTVAIIPQLAYAFGYQQLRIYSSVVKDTRTDFHYVPCVVSTLLRTVVIFHFLRLSPMFILSMLSVGLVRLDRGSLTNLRSSPTAAGFLFDRK